MAPRREIHQTKTLRIAGRECEVDIGMVPVVKWLNKVGGVITEYCCEGQDNSKYHKPYVLFGIWDTKQDTLIKLSKFLAKIDTQIDRQAVLSVVAPNRYVPYMRYRIDWPSKDALRGFIKKAGFKAESAENKLGPSNIKIKTPKTTPSWKPKKKKKKR